MSSNEAVVPQNIYSFYKQAYEKIVVSLPNEFEIDPLTGVRKNTNVELLSAVRELLSNALIHAFYGDGRVVIKQFDDYFEFSNPGQLRVSENQYKLGGKSNPRNQFLMI